MVSIDPLARKFKRIIFVFVRKNVVHVIPTSCILVANNTVGGPFTAGVVIMIS